MSVSDGKPFTIYKIQGQIVLVWFTIPQEVCVMGSLIVKVNI